LHICIDLRPLETGNKYRGYGYYIKNLVSDIIKVDQKNRYIFVVYSKKNPLLACLDSQKTDSFVMKRARVRPRFRWIVDQFSLPKVIKKINPDIYVSLDTALPFLTSLSARPKTVVTIHDVIPIVLKNEYHLPLDRILEYNLKFAAAKRATRVVTISQFSKLDIAKNLKIAVAKISCIYESTDDKFSKPDQQAIDLIKDRFAKGKRYLLTVGDYYGVDPRKNYIFLVESFAKFVGIPGNDDFTLLFVGKSGGNDNEYSKILTRAKELEIEDKIVFTGFVTDAELSTLYAGAEVFLYPTKYEGFGLPILQAMSCGCPVVAADNTSIPEVAGDAAELFKTQDEKSFLYALIKVIRDKSRYRQKGYENIKRFSWQKAAREFVSLLESL